MMFCLASGDTGRMSDLPTLEPRRRARALYWQGWAVSAIADYLNTPRATISAWKQRDHWNTSSALTRVESGLEHRFIQLVNKTPKTGSDYKEIDLLGRQMERLARVRRYEQPGGHEGDLNPKINQRNQRKNNAKNSISEEQKQQLHTVFHEHLFAYQRQWYEAGKTQRIRNILKSRQIGATWYFAREALLDAVETGRNQIFLSASKAQAHVFKQYILHFAKQTAELDLKGDPIVLNNGATLYFLGTNSRTAQSYHFSFGDPVPVLDRRELFEQLECVPMYARWYNPPISFDGLARSFRASPHHSSALYLKRNLLAATFIEHRLLSRGQFARLALDWLVFGNGYLERRHAVSGKPLELIVAPAKTTRRGIENGRWFLLKNGHHEHEFAKDSIWQIMEPDINQEIYGLPEYLSALQSAYLDESATLFRRRYYLNGSHAGFILYVNDAAQQMSDIDALLDALKHAKGPGNFRNLFLYSPNGKKDGVQVIPISEVAAKDEFLGIKEASRDDILAAHRIPPQLLGIVPSNSGGFGDITKAAQIWARHELEPLQLRLMELNQWMGEEIIQFKPYALPDSLI